MTDEEFSLDAFRCLIDDLEPVRRKLFMERLEREPEVAAELKHEAEAIARFACDAAPAEPMSPSAQRIALGSILAATAKGPRSAGRPAPSKRWVRFGWPLAAALLLGLNVAQFYRPAPRDFSSRTDSSNGEGANPGGGTTTANRPANGADAAGRGRPATTDELRRLEKLRADYAAMQRKSEALQAEYDGMMQELTQRIATGHGIGRMAAMELVDAKSYARGERNGLISLARGLLTTPGIVAVAPLSPPAKTSATTPSSGAVNAGQSDVVASMSAGVQTGAGTNSVVSISPIPDLSALSANGNSTPTPNPQARPGPVPTTPAASAETSTAPYAWSVFDESEGQGYLNLYNLPAVSPDQVLLLWVKSPDSGDYRPVGEVPAKFYGGSGSVSYKLPDATAMPTEILVTQEPKNAPAAKPTGPAILHGP